MENSFFLPVQDERSSSNQQKRLNKSSSKKSLVKEHIESNPANKVPSKSSSSSLIKKNSVSTTSLKTEKKPITTKVTSFSSFAKQRKESKQKPASPNINKNINLKKSTDVDDGLNRVFCTTFGPEDVSSVHLFDRMNNDWVDGNYLTSLMPQQAKDTKLEILDILDDMCCSVMESKAESGKLDCEFPIPKHLLGYTEFDQKEMANLLYTRITSRGGIIGYGKPLPNGTYSLVLTWQPIKKSASTQSVKSQSSNKK